LLSDRERRRAPPLRKRAFCAAAIRDRRRRVTGVVYIIEFEYAGPRLLTER